MTQKGLVTLIGGALGGLLLLLLTYLLGRSHEAAEQKNTLLKAQDEWSEQYDTLLKERNELAQTAAERIIETETIIRRVEVPVTVDRDNECRIDYSAVEWMRDVAGAGRAAEAGPDAGDAAEVPGGITIHPDIGRAVVFTDSGSAASDAVEPVQ